MTQVVSTTYLCNQQPHMPSETELWPERVITDYKVLLRDSSPGRLVGKASTLLLGHGYYIVVHSINEQQPFIQTKGITQCVIL